MLAQGSLFSRCIVHSSLNSSSCAYLRGMQACLQFNDTQLSATFSTVYSKVLLAWTKHHRCQELFRPQHTNHRMETFSLQKWQVTLHLLTNTLVSCPPECRTQSCSPMPLLSVQGKPANRQLICVQ
jgi:hypothetical protein